MNAPPADPIELFDRWQREARGERAGARLQAALYRASRKAFYLATGEGLPHADAAALATSTPDGVPSVRIVLVKAARDTGFDFYTNYGSRKGRELEDNPRASLAFHWPFPPRQVRVEGSVVRLSGEESEAYWQSRPRGSQIGAIASRQSEGIAGREELRERAKRAVERHLGQPIRCPDYWGGYRVVPTRIEFWEGRADRLHDRFEYVPEGAGWALRWLAP